MTQDTNTAIGAADANYHLIDRFLRNNLDDDDYAEFSAALDALASTTAQPVAEPANSASHGQAPAGTTEPTEQQILEAAEKAGLWPNTVHSWIPAFHRYHKELAKAQPTQAQAVPMTSRQINDARCADLDPDDRPEPWAFTQGVRAAEKHHSIKGGQRGTE